MASPLSQKISSGGGALGAITGYAAAGFAGAAVGFKLGKAIVAKMQGEMKVEKKSFERAGDAKSQAAATAKVWIPSKASVGTHPSVAKAVISAVRNPRTTTQDPKINQANTLPKPPAGQTDKELCKAFEKKASELQGKIEAGNGSTEELKTVFATRAEGANVVRVPADHEINKIFTATTEQKWVSHLDSGAVAQGNMRVQAKNIEGSNKCCLEFKLNAPYREKLNTDLAVIEKNLPEFEESVKKASALGGVGSVTISKEPYTFRKKNENGVFTAQGGYKPQGNFKKNATVISFEGVGRVVLMNNPNLKSLYSNVSIEIEGDHPNPAQAAQQMVAMLGMGPIVSPQEKEDESRLKLAVAFRENHPKAAANFETTKQFFELPVDDLRKKMIELEPKAKETLEKYIDNPKMMVKGSTFGRKEWGLADMDKQMASQGALGLMVGVQGHGDGSPMKKSSEDFVAMLFSGLLSNVERRNQGDMRGGSTELQDLENSPGGAFARVVHEKHTEHVIRERYPYAKEGIAIIMDLSPVKFGCHMNHADVYGRNDKELSMAETTKKVGEMVLSDAEIAAIDEAIQQCKDRITAINNKSELSIMDKFSQAETVADEISELDLKKTSGMLVDNEIVKKGGFPAKDFKGVVVGTKEEKEEFIGHVKELCNAALGDANTNKLGSIEKDASGNLLINGKKLDDFVIVGEKFSKEMFENL